MPTFHDWFSQEQVVAVYLPRQQALAAQLKKVAEYLDATSPADIYLCAHCSL
jgi:hypothetical protein